MQEHKILYSDAKAPRYLNKYGFDITKKVAKKMGWEINEPKKMGVLGGLKSAIGDVSSATKTVGKGVAKVGKSLVNTTGNIANFLTGGPRQQTYGYFAEYFQDEKQKIKKEKPFTQIRPSFNLPAAPPQYGASTEKLNEIFDFMKRTQEKQIRQLEVQNSFIESKLELDKERYSELLKAITKFVNVKTVTTTRVEDKKEDSESWIDKIKRYIDNIIEPFKVLKPFLKILSTIAKWPLIEWITKYATRSALAIALLSYSKELSPGTLFDKEGNPTEDYKKILLKNKQKFKRPFNSEEPDLVPMINADESGKNKEKWQKELESGTKLFQDEADALKIQYDLDWPESNIINKKNIDAMPYEAPKGQTFIPKYSYPDAPQMNEDIARERGRQAIKGDFVESTAGAGQSSADFSATDPRRIDTATPAPTTPVSAPVARVIDENRALESERMVEPVTNKPIVVKNNSAQSVNEPPLASTATTRDEEPMIDFVFSKQRNKSRGY